MGNEDAVGVSNSESPAATASSGFWVYTPPSETRSSEEACEANIAADIEGEFVPKTGVLVISGGLLAPPKSFHLVACLA